MTPAEIMAAAMFGEIENDGTAAGGVVRPGYGGEITNPLECTHAAIAALDKEGFVIVPKVASPEMKLVGARSIGETMNKDNHTERSNMCWQAMIGAVE